jgi:hypothetical protein
MFGNGKIWPYALVFLAVVIVAEALAGWRSFGFVIMGIVALVGIVDFVWTVVRQRR